MPVQSHIIGHEHNLSAYNWVWHLILHSSTHHQMCDPHVAKVLLRKLRFKVICSPLHVKCQSMTLLFVESPSVETFPFVPQLEHFHSSICILPCCCMELGDKIPRSVPANSGHVVTCAVLTEKPDEQTLGAFGSRLADNVCAALGPNSTDGSNNAQQ